MKKTFFLVYTGLIIGFTAQNDLVAQWEPLFNRKDLKGWKQLNGKARYEVKEGMIIGTTVFKEPNSFLATEKEYGDFIQCIGKNRI